jgi:hypothetical protein
LNAGLQSPKNGASVKIKKAIAETKRLERLLWVDGGYFKFIGSILERIKDRYDFAYDEAIKQCGRTCDGPCDDCDYAHKEALKALESYNESASESG